MNFYFSDEGSATMVAKMAKVKGYDFSNLLLLRQDKTRDAAVNNEIKPVSTLSQASLLSLQEDLSLAMLQ